RRMARHGDSRPAWLIEGRLPEVPRRSKVWRPAASARNRRPGRSESAFTRVLDALWGPPAGHYDPAARSSLYGAGGNAGSQKRGPRPKIATVERMTLRLAALHPPRLAEGSGKETTNPGAAKRRGNQETYAV